MAKTNGTWTYSVVAPDGHIEEQGDIPTCARCHGESPHDAVFGPRTPPKERAPDAEKDEGLSPSDAEGPAGKSKRPAGGKKRRLARSTSDLSPAATQQKGRGGHGVSPEGGAPCPPQAIRVGC